MAKRIAISGATGFVGTHAAAELLKRGHSLTVLARDPSRVNYHGDIKVITGNIENQDQLLELVEGADAIVHLAGAIAALRRRDYFAVNEQGTRRLVAAATQAGVRRFIHVSSLAAREPQLSAYGASKRAGEESVAAAASLRAIILRPPVVYGPGDKGTFPLVAALTRRAALIPGRRDQRFSLLHATDLARLIADAVDHEIGGCFEPSDGKSGGYGWSDLAEAAGRAEGISIRLHFLPRVIAQGAAAGASGIAQIRRRPGMASLGKIAELYHHDWVSRGAALQLAEPIGFEAGFTETAAWYRAQGWLPPARHADRRRANSSQETKA